MGSFFFTVLSFVVALGILITVHEFGHFWVARKLGVKVLCFSIGFGAPLWKRTSPVDGVEYVIAAVPLGGYVKMLDEREEPVPEADLPRAFNRQRLAVRSAIVTAGPVANFLFTIIAFWLIFMIGDFGMRPLVGEVVQDSPAASAGFETGDEILAVGDQEALTWESVPHRLLASALEGKDLPIKVRDVQGEERIRLLPHLALDELAEAEDPVRLVGLSPQRPVLPPVVGEVVPDQAAARAGLQAGDRVRSVDGQPLADWVELVKYVQARPDQALSLEVERAGATLSLIVRAGSREQNGTVVGYIGAGVQEIEGLYDDYRVLVRLGPIEALGAAVGKTWDISRLVLRMLGGMLSGEVSVKNLSGPIAIAESAAKTASYGVVAFFKFLAWVSISLGILNLLPIPVLDGGHLLYFLIEGIKGSPLTEEAQVRGQRIGMLILLLLMGLAFYVDLSRLLG